MTAQGNGKMAFNDYWRWVNGHLRGDGRRALRSSTARIWFNVQYALEENGRPQTVRQLFYRLVAYGLVPKTDAGYRKVQAQILRMRRDGFLSYDDIADQTRVDMRVNSYANLSDYAEVTASAYRRAIWLDQGVKVFIWCEKLALAGVLYDVTARWDVPLLIGRGFNSESFLWSVAQDMLSDDRPSYVYYFADYDKPGQDAMNHAQERLADFGAAFRLYNAAITREQIDRYGVAMRKSKHKEWGAHAAELDALPANILRDICRRCIEQHIDGHQLQMTKRTEQLERESLRAAMSRLVGASTD